MMQKSFKDVLKHRRSYYSITNQSPISDEEIERIINFAVTHVPSAFNSQSTRVVLLLGENHKKLWEIVKDAIRKIVTPEAFKNTESKIVLRVVMVLYCSLKINMLCKRCRIHLSVIKIIFLGGLYKHRPCIS